MSTQATTVLAQAARMGGYAPSIHNTQPWRWRVDGARLELIAVRDRQLEVTDPTGRLLTVSCGAALHHVRLAIAAEGWAATVERTPDADPDVLARITLAGRVDPEPRTMRLTQAIRIRHTDRRPGPDIEVPATALSTLVDAAAAEGAGVHVLRRDGVIRLASAAAQAQYLEGIDPAWREELAYWAGRGGEEPLGVPAASIPDRSPPTTVPGRDFGRPGSLPIVGGHDRFARYAILYGAGDTPVGWLRGGEALSAVWLVATELGLTVVPLSAAVEVPGPRAALRHLLADLGQPYLALRVGVGDPDHAGPPPTPRLPAAQVVEIVPTT